MMLLGGLWWPSLMQREGQSAAWAAGMWQWSRIIEVA